MADLAPHQASPMRGPAAERTLRCPTCQYPITGLPTNRCPECGAWFDPDALRPQTPRSPRLATCWTVGVALLLFALDAIQLRTDGRALPGLFTLWCILTTFTTWPTGGAPFASWTQALISATWLPTVFLLWSIPACLDIRRIPTLSGLAVTALVSISAWVILASWRAGLEHMGLTYVWIVIGANTVAALALASLWRRNRRRPALWSSLAFHALAIYCLGDVWLPHLGEFSI